MIFFKSERNLDSDVPNIKYTSFKNKTKMRF
jgi:hypothetical protein